MSDLTDLLGGIVDDAAGAYTATQQPGTYNYPYAGNSPGYGYTTGKVSSSSSSMGTIILVVLVGVGVYAFTKM